MLKRGDWSKATAFEKFYHKEILIDNQKFQGRVFLESFDER